MTATVKVKFVNVIFFVFSVLIFLSANSTYASELTVQETWDRMLTDLVQQEMTNKNFIVKYASKDFMDMLAQALNGDAVYKRSTQSEKRKMEDKAYDRIYQAMFVLPISYPMITYSTEPQTKWEKVNDNAYIVTYTVVDEPIKMFWTKQDGKWGINFKKD